MRLAGRDGRDGGLAGLADLGVLGRRAGVVLRALEVDHVADLQAGLCVAGGLAAGAAACILDAEALVDFGGDLAVAVVEVVARAALIRVVPVHGHVAAVQVVHAVVFSGRPDEALDAVALADVGHEIQQRGVCLRGDGPVRRAAVVGDFDGDGPLVVGVGRGAPRAVCLVDVQGDPAVGADAVVAGRLPRRAGEQVAAGLDGAVAGHTVDRDGVDLLGALARVVRAELGVDHQRAVTHCRRLLSRWSARRESRL